MSHGMPGRKAQSMEGAAPYTGFCGQNGDHGLGPPHNESWCLATPKDASISGGSQPGRALMAGGAFGCLAL